MCGVNPNEVSRSAEQAPLVRLKKCSTTEKVTLIWSCNETDGALKVTYDLKAI